MQTFTRQTSPHRPNLPGVAIVSACLLLPACVAGKPASLRHTDKAASLFRVGETLSAIAEYREAAELDPENIDALVRLGGLYMVTGQHESALETAARILDIDPNLSLAHEQRAYSLLALERREESALALRRAGELNPSNFRAFTNLGRVFHLLGQPEEAAAEFRRVLEIDPNDFDAMDGLAGVYLSQDRLTDAAEMLEAAARISPENTGIWKRLGHVHALMNRLDEAERDYAEASRLDTYPLAKGFTPLHLAAEMGDDNLIRHMLNNGADLGAKTVNEWTPLMSAISAGQTSAFEILVEHPVDINIKEGGDGWAPINIAARQGTTRMVEVLLDRGADIESETRAGFTPLYLAAVGEKTATVELLLARGASINKKTAYGLTPLHVAADAGNLDIVRRLLDKGAETDPRGQNLLTPLHLSAIKGSTEVVEELLTRGAKPDARTTTGLTPLMLAAKSGSPESVEAILMRKTPINDQDQYGRTALHLAHSHPMVIELLLKNKGNPTATTNDGETPLHFAAQYGLPESVRNLISAGVDLEAQDAFGRTPLHGAAKDADEDVVNILLELGADPEARDFMRWTPLHVASRYNRTDAIATLLKRGIETNPRTNAGLTPLHLAGWRGYRAAVDLLVLHGADPSAGDKTCRNPARMARSNGNVAISKLLDEKAAADTSQSASTRSIMSCESMNVEEPRSPEGSLIGISVVFLDGAELSRTHKTASGADPSGVYFVRLELDGDSTVATRFIVPSFSQGNKFYLMNAIPGRYAVIAAKRTKAMYTAFPALASTEMTALGTSEPNTLTVYFPRETTETSVTSIKPGTFAFMGSFVIEIENNALELEAYQQDYSRRIGAGGALGNRPGRIVQWSKDSNTEIQFLQASMKLLNESGWSGLIDRRLEEIGGGGEEN